MPDNSSLLTTARLRAQEQLRGSPQFKSLPHAEQLATYRDTVEDELAQLRATAMGSPELATGMAPSVGGLIRRGIRSVTGPQRASDLIDDTKHGSKRIDQAGQLAGEFVREVDFPSFVRDLLKAVFDANIEVTLAQMETYQSLLKSASESVARFVREIDNTAAFGYLAEKQGDQFTLSFDDEETDEDGQPAAALLDKDGNKIDLGDNEIKAKIMDAKIAMAKEHRAMIREMILMGVTRLVVEKGTIKASVLFDMKATEKIKRADKAMARESQSVTRHLGGGFLGFVGGGKTKTNTKSSLSVSSVKSEADASLAAKLSGSVEIVYKSDYFKLDNFAAMYAPQPQPGTQTEAQPGVPAVQGTVPGQ